MSAGQTAFYLFFESATHSSHTVTGRTATHNEYEDTDVEYKTTILGLITFSYHQIISPNLMIHSKQDT